MIIPNKHSGYQAGIRVYPFGGGGGGEQLPGTGDSQIGNTGGTTPVGTGVAIPSSGGSFAQPQVQRGSLDSVGGGGRTYFQQRPDVAASFSQNSLGMDPTQFAQQHFQKFGQFEGSSDPSRQFYQPVYQPQFQNFNMGNPMSVSQYGQQPSFGSGFGGGFMPQMQTPFQQPMQQQFNPYTNNFGGGFGGGFMPQQQFQQPMQQFMPQQQFQPQMNMGMQTPFSSGMSQPRQQGMSSGPAQAIIGRSSQMRGTPNVMRRAQGGITSLMGKA